jgi:superfamily II DNA or RNA helicase
MTFKGTLYGFQSEDVEQLKSKRSRLVGNDPGTGKTYVGLALDQLNRAGDGNSKVTLPAYQKTLIVAPKSVLGVWDDHCMDLTEDDIFLIDTDKQPHKAREEFLKPLLDRLLHLSLGISSPARTQNDKEEPCLHAYHCR